MTTKRRAELQRKLSMGAVPRPPADLSDRIKADIPQYLQLDTDRSRFTGSIAFSMRIAASILLLITTAFVTLRLLEPETRQTASMAPRPKLVPAVTRYQTTTESAAQERPAAADEVRLEIAQDTIPVPISAAAPAPQQVAQRNRRQNDQAIVETITGGYAEESRVEDRAARERQPAIAEFGRPAERDDERAEADASLAAPAAAPAPPSAPVHAPVTVAASAPLISEAHADMLQLKQEAEVFGISIDPNAFNEVKKALQNGTRPPSDRVNVDALVNYFAGPPARSPRSDVAIEVEASPAPVEADGDHAVLRFTVDTSRIEVKPHQSTPPVATDARVEIEFDRKAVAKFRRIGGPPVTSESMLLHNLSVTGLYQLELHPGLKSTQRVATIRLHYRSVKDGSQHSTSRLIRGEDLSRDWSQATRRHRLASLGAVWSETLKSSAIRFDVAQRAEELATQEPDDSRARELANAASATAGGGRK